MKMKRLKLCEFHRQEKYQSEYDECNCDYCKLETKNQELIKILRETQHLLCNGADGAITDTVWKLDGSPCTLWEDIEYVLGPEECKGCGSDIEDAHNRQGGLCERCKKDNDGKAS